MKSGMGKMVRIPKSLEPSPLPDDPKDFLKWYRDESDKSFLRMTYRRIDQQKKMMNRMKENLDAKK